MRTTRSSVAIDDMPSQRHTPFDSRAFLSRIAICVMGMMLATSLLITRLIYLQIVGRDHYATLSRDNRIKISPLVPNRGVIFDRNGEVLADNIPNYSLEIVPVRAGDLKRTLAELTDLLGLTDDELQRFQSSTKRSKGYDRIPLRLQLSEEEIARFAVKMHRFPGVEVRAHQVRTYPYGFLTSHVVGYVGRISQAETEYLDRSAYSGTLHIGKSGLEKSYEQLLHGSAGYEEIESDVTGRPLRSLGSVAPLPGNDLILSLDLKLQRIAYDALGEHSGAVVAMEPATGRVLAMVSKPTFDPTPFVNGISRKAYEQLQQDPERPLYDRALRGLYPPGSTVKPFVAMAGLESANRNPAKRVSCPGWFSLPGSSHR
jgi:penicillin-binding protein 2